MFVKRKKLQVIDGETLMDLRLEPTRFCVDTLLPQGVCMLSGAAKIGKSWMVLDWCVRIAKGEPVWNLSTHRGSVLYLALEDRMSRIQDRLNLLTDEVPGNTYFAVAAERLDSGLCDQIRDFVEDHPDIVLEVHHPGGVHRLLAGPHRPWQAGEIDLGQGQAGH